jgi:hypothetical protein
MHTAPTACPGRENHAWREAELKLAQHGTPHDLAPRWGQPIHCEPCSVRARQQLGDLPELVAAIHLEAAHGSRGPKIGAIGRSTVTVPPWPGQASRILTDHIVGGLTELEDDIRELRQLRARPGRGIEGATLTGAVTFLNAHLDWALAHHPAAHEIHERDSANPAAQISGWHRAALRFTARDLRLDHRRAPCPRCELLSLYRADGDDYIECRNAACGNLLTPAEFDEHARALASQVREKQAA